MIGIVDIGVCNLRSISNAVEEVGFDASIEEESRFSESLTHLILPGVGNFHAVMERLERKGFKEAIRDFAESGRPVLGICLGMQLLSSTGAEGGTSEGLGLIPGHVERLAESPEYRVPHIGWNTISARRAHPVFEGLKPDRDFYFVHLYEMKCNDDDDVIAVTDYGKPVCAVVGRRNVIGFQFHPEKSQVNGLKLLENFCNWDGRC